MMWQPDSRIPVLKLRDKNKQIYIVSVTWCWPLGHTSSSKLIHSHELHSGIWDQHCSSIMESITCNLGIPAGQLKFKSLLLFFQSCTLLMFLAKQQKMVQVLGYLCPQRRFGRSLECLASAQSSSGYGGQLRREAVDRTLSLCFSISFSLFDSACQINAYISN